MSASARTASSSGGEEDRRHHAAARQRIDVDRVALVNGLSMRGEYFSHHLGVSREALLQRSLNVIRTQRCITLDHVDQPTERHPAPNIAAMSPVEISDTTVDAGSSRLLRHTFRAFRFGSSDPCVRVDGNTLIMASTSPVGPGWLSATVPAHDPVPRVHFGGAAADLIRRRCPDPLGQRDTFRSLRPAHPLVERLQHDFGDLRIGASGDIYKAALTATLGQRITAAEAVAQWVRLCRTFPNPVDTPFGQLLAPPDPAVLGSLAPWQLHPLGIEESRGRTLIGIARVFQRGGEHQHDGALALRRLAIDVPRFGPWTRALVEAEALGNPDAVAVGDFHLKNVVAHALRGRPRGTDDEMIDALSPYAGNRGRVLAWIGLAGITAPKFGPRRRNIDFRRF